MAGEASESDDDDLVFDEPKPLNVAQRLGRRSRFVVDSSALSVARSAFSSISSAHVVRSVVEAGHVSSSSTAIVPYAGTRAPPHEENHDDKPSVSKHIFEAIAKQTMPVFGAPALHPVCCSVMDIVKAQRADAVDADIAAIAHAMFDETNRQILTKRALGESLDVKRKKLRSCTEKLASAALLCDQGLRRSLEHSARAVKWTNLLYVDAARYDETPVEVSLPEYEYEVVVKQAVRDSSDVGQLGISRTTVQVNELVHAKETDMAKVFQTETRYGMLLKAPDNAAADGCPRFVMIVGQPATYLQFLDSCTAETMKHALQHTCTPSAVTRDFGMRVRNVTRDKMGGSVKAERGNTKGEGRRSVRHPERL